MAEGAARSKALKQCTVVLVQRSSTTCEDSVLGLVQVTTYQEALLFVLGYALGYQFLHLPV